MFYLVVVVTKKLTKDPYLSIIMYIYIYHVVMVTNFCREYQNNSIMVIKNVLPRLLKNISLEIAYGGGKLFTYLYLLNWQSNIVNYY